MKRPCKQDNSWQDVVCEKAWCWRKQGKSGIVGKIALAHVAGVGKMAMLTAVFTESEFTGLNRHY